MTSGDRHDQSEATGTQTRPTPFAQGRPQRPAGEEPSAPGPQAKEGGTATSEKGEPDPRQSRKERPD